MSDQKVPKTINDFISDNVQALASLFPTAVKDGQVDFTALKEELGQFEEVGKEKYELTWAGKKEAKKKAQEDVFGRTLKYIHDDSKNPETTENLYIEGDNLEVLKLLRQNYYGSIKMIYIDPPYNTGNNFVYNDSFKMDAKESDIAEGTLDEYGERTQKNQKSTNRFHANWLNMMYPRLKVAKDLLTDDGVIFISINDNEVHNLRKICDDVFGGANFINIITVKTKIGGVSGSSEGKSLKDATEFILIYAKNKAELLLNPVYIRTPLFDRITSYLSEGKSWKYTSVMTKLDDKVLIKEDTTRGMKFWGYRVLETKSIAAYAKELGISQEDVYNQYADKIFRTTNAQSSVRQTVIKETRGHDYPMYGCEYVPIKGKNEGQTIEILYKGGTTSDQRNMMMFLSDVVEQVDGTYYYMDKVSSLWDDIEYNNLTKEGDTEFPNGKKPIKMLQRMINLATDKDSVVLDFFSGSASTAHAVMQSNIEDNGVRRFILVQIPEKTDNVELPTICDIGKERIRRAGEKIKHEVEEYNAQLKMGEELKPVPDIGFKVFRTADTNIKWNLIESEGQMDIEAMTHTPDLADFTFGFNDIDVVYEIMLRQKDIPLSEKLEVLSDIGARTYLYGGAYLICLEIEITEDLIDQLASLNPLPIKFVFRDSAFKDDISLKDDTFRRLKNLIDRNSGENKNTYTVEDESIDDFELISFLVVE